MPVKKLCLVLFLIFAQFANAQLSNFTLNITKTDETCGDNGSLTFSVSNTTPGAVMIYSIYLLPNTTTPVSVQSATSLSGLGAGNYRVVATQSLGGNTGFQQGDITIADLVQILNYQINGLNEICGNDGSITVNVTNGSAVGYEIFSGPMTRPLQTSNTFTGLVAGVYQIRAFDNCNQGTVQTFTLLRLDKRLVFNLTTPSLASCATVNLGFSFQSLLPAPQGAIKFPIQVVTTLSLPSGTQTFTNTIGSGGSFTLTAPYLPNQPYNYSFTITDGCNTIYTLSGSIPNLAMNPIAYSTAPQDCTFMYIAFSGVTALTLTAAPSTYGGAVPQNFTSIIQNNRVNVGNATAGTYVFTATDMCGAQQVITVVVELDDQMGTPPYSTLSNRTCFDATVFIYDVVELIMVSAPSAYTAFPLPHDYSSSINFANYAVILHLPVGTYVFSTIDKCGNVRPLSVTISPESLPPSALVLEGCDLGVGTLQVSGQMTQISVIAAPAAYATSLPINLTSSLNGGRLTLDNLPPGNYTFQSVNACSASFLTNATVLGYQQSTTATITPNCGSFNLSLTHNSNNNIGSKFWLQKFNPLNSTWGHPLTGVVYTNGTPTATNSFELSVLAANLNLAYSGHFRILKSYNSYVNGTSAPGVCLKTIDEFDFSPAPKINDIYSISCGSTFEVVVNATGNTALVYRITTKNGQPFLVQNGSSGLFSGLVPGLYVFEVEDTCHNTISSQFEVLNPAPMVISATPIACDGDNASLSVPNFSFLAYQWWKDNNTGTILSTTSSLNFPSFNSAANNGIYHVRIVYVGNPNSCLNQVLNYTINVSTVQPHAGNDNAVSYCGSQGVMDLTTLLLGNFDTTGTWTEVTASGTLINNLWNSASVGFGTYKFRYEVTGSCSLTDAALVTITIKEIPQMPVASVDPVVCEEQDLHLFATTVPNVGYHWAGPNGFLSSVQNPVFNSVTPYLSGTYTVYANQDGCLSTNSTVEVLVHLVPKFILYQDCVNNQYQAWPSKQNESSYDEGNSTYSWTGPNTFTSNQSTITITAGNTGIYALTIVNEHGCQTTNSIPVDRTNCFIPNVITPDNDGTNDSFDLTGFNVERLEIYSRWGRKVYEKDNYTNEWHGQNSNGGLLPDSTYYYVIRLSDEKEVKIGWIFLSK